ncbi:MAG: hypothetical protein OEY89_16055 [Gammaproteobacteria bacterium]|nr:hypothetical protein [Gammaproteobacteria bacterium]
MPESKNWFIYRGKRNYLHSTSLFDFIVTEYAKKVGTPSDIDFVFIRKSKNICRIETKNYGIEGLVASYEDNNAQYYMYETENTITERNLYNEPVIGAHFTIKDNTTFVRISDQDNTFIELAVAAYKELLVSLFPQHKDKYVFSRIQLAFIPTQPFEILYKRKIAKKFYEGKIIVDGTDVGLIYFGV